MNVNIRNLPWKSIRRLVYQFRKQFFVEEVDPYEPPYFASDTDVGAVRSELAGVVPVDPGPWAGVGFTNGWEISYHYKEEDLNMRLPLFLPGGREADPEGREYYQLHVRGWEMDGGEVVLRMHVELEPTEYPKGHLRGDHLSEPEAFALFEEEVLPRTEIEGEIRRDGADGSEVAEEVDSEVAGDADGEAAEEAAGEAAEASDDAGKPEL